MYTADGLVSRVKDVATIPPRVDTTDQKILDEANGEMSKRLIPLFRRLRGGFLQDSVDYAIVASQARYVFPARAVLSTLESIKYIDAQGNEQYALKFIPNRRIGQLSTQWWPITDSTSPNPTGFYDDSGAIVLYPVPSSATGSLRVYYPRRPGKLVLDTVVASQHTAVGTVLSLTASTITLNANHNGWPANTTIDIMAAYSPFKLFAKDIATTTAAAGTATITVGTDLTTLGIAAGDYVTLAKQAYIPEIPEEWHEYLVDLTAARMLEKLGQYSAGASMRKTMTETYSELFRATTPREAQTSKYIVPSLR